MKKILLVLLFFYSINAQFIEVSNELKIYGDNVRARNLAYDDFGNKYIGIAFQNSIILGDISINSINNYDAILLKYSPSDSLIWYYHFPDSNSLELIFDTKVNNNKLYLTLLQSGKRSLLILDLDGNKLFEYNDPDYTVNYFTFDDQNNLYLTERYEVSPDYGKSFRVVKINNQYEINVLKEFFGYSIGMTHISYFENHLILGGTYTQLQLFGNLYESDYGDGAFLLKTDEVLNPKKIRTINPRDGNINIIDFSINDKGDPIFTGSINASTVDIDSVDISVSGDFNDFYIAKFNDNFDFQWLKRYNNESTPFGILAKDTTDILVTGAFNSTSSVNFGDTVVTSKGSDDIFVLNINENGNVKWIKTIGGTGSDIGFAITNGFNKKNATIISRVEENSKIISYIFDIAVKSSPIIGTMDNLYSSIDNYVDSTKSLQFNTNNVTDLDGQIISSVWYLNDEIISNEQTFSYDFPLGTSIVKLKVTDDDDLSDSTSFSVNISTYQSSSFNDRISGLSAIDDNIYIVSEGDALYATNLELNQKMKINVNGSIKSSTLIGIDSSIYISSTDNNLYGFSKSAVPLWSAVPLGGEVAATPNFDRKTNRLFVGIENNNFFSIDANSGKVIWSFFTDSPVRSSSVINMKRELFFTSIKGTLYIIELDSLESQLKYNTYYLGDSVLASPALDEYNNLYIATKNGKLVKGKINDDSFFEVIVDSKFSEGFSASPILDSYGNIYIGDIKGNFLCIDSSLSTVNWEFSTNFPISSTAVITPENFIFFANEGGELFGIDENGNKTFYFNSNSKITSPVLFNKGNIIVGDYSNNVFSFYFPNKNLKTINISSWSTFQGNNRRTGYSADNLINYSVPNSIQLVSPMNSELDTEFKVNLVWKRNPLAEQYNLQLSTDSTFNSEIIYNKTLSDSLYTTEGLGNFTKYFWRVSGENNLGFGSWSEVYSFTTKDTIKTGVEIFDIPTQYELSQNYPNPFNPSTIIKYGIPEESNVKISIYSILGEEIAELINTQQSAGYYNVTWNAQNLSSGIYLVRISASSVNGSNNFINVKKMLLVK